MSLNWGPGAQGGFQNALGMGMQIGDRVGQARDRAEYRSALGALAAEPGNVNALATVFQHNPQVGAMLQDRAEEAAFRGDAGAFVTGNALLGPAPAMRGAAMGADNPAGVMPAAAPDAEGGPDLSSLGQPQTPNDQAFLRMLQRDPVKALKIRSALRDNFVSQAKAESELYGLAIGELSRATDPAAWQAARARVLADAQALGLEAGAAVPADYPGPEGVQALMAKAMPIKEQLDLMLRTANVEADNVRADRSTDSLIETRQGRLAEYQRHNRATESNARRGQDIRAQSGGGGRRRGSGAAGGGDALPVMSSPEEAMKLPSGTRFRTPDGMVKVRP